MIRKLFIGVVLLMALWVFVYPRAEHLIGPLGVWGPITGRGLAKGDLAPVDFARLVQRSSPNDFIVCGEGFCREAKVDRVAPVFAMSPPDLLARIDTVLRAIAGSEALADGPKASHLRFVVKTRWMRYPDVIDAEVFEVAPGQSTLALYSRSVVGSNDFGVNAARLNAIMDELQVLSMPDTPAVSN